MRYSSLERPESLPQVFVEAWNRRDPQKLASIFDEDADFINVVGIWWHDRASIERAHAYGLEQIFNDSDLRLGKVAVKHLTEDIAVVHARMRLTGQTPVEAVDTPRARQNMFTFVVHRTDEGWSCAAAQNTDIVPGAETNVVDASGAVRPADYRDPDEKQ